MHYLAGNERQGCCHPSRLSRREPIYRLSDIRKEGLLFGAASVKSLHGQQHFTERLEGHSLAVATRHKETGLDGPVSEF
jgi:hypothetical protein